MESLIGSIERHRSLSIVGMEKNTGKTECLNYVMRNLSADKPIAVTSIGTDGEQIDLLTATHKPEIELRQGTIFATAVGYYARRRMVSEVLAVGPAYTAAGEVVTARALTPGKVVLSGPSTVKDLSLWVRSVERYGVGLSIIDGALSRMSGASPTVSEAMVLSTGAALSLDMSTLVRQTAHTVALMQLPPAGADVAAKLEGKKDGSWALLENEDIYMGSLLTFDGTDAYRDVLEAAGYIYLSGAITEKFLKYMQSAGLAAKTEIVVEDFTKIFVSSAIFDSYMGAGGRLSVLRRSKLLAVTVNPVSPAGFTMDSDMLIGKISGMIDVPVYDIMRCN